MSTFAIRFAETAGRDYKKIIEKTDKISTSKYREKKNESVNSFKELRVSGVKLRNIKKNTKKSLILAQDER